MKYINKSNENEKRSPEEIEKMIEEASKHYGNFLVVLQMNQQLLFSQMMKNMMV